MHRDSLLRNLFLVFFFMWSCTAFSQEGGQAIRLNNLDYWAGGDFVYFPSHDYGFSDALTVAAWVKWESVPSTTIGNPHEPGLANWANLVTMDYINANDQGQFWLQHNSSNTRFEWAVKVNSGTRIYLTSTTAPVQGVWYYLVGVYDGSGSTTMRFYINGVEEAHALSAAISGNIKTWNNLMRMNLGRIPSDYRLFNGQLDEVRIWKRALTAEEIRMQMHSKSTVNPASLASYYPMNSTSGTTVIDSTGTLNGTFYSALVDVHTVGYTCGNPGFANYTTSSPWKMADGDKTWVVNEFSGMSTRTVAGAGIDQTNSVVSNTCNALTMTYGWGAGSPDNRTTPVVDFVANDSWYGIENAAQTSQWQTSTVLVASAVKYVATTALTTLGPAGTEMRVTITSTPDETNNIIAYRSGSATDPPVSSGETFPSGINRRAAIVWGSKVFGAVTATEDFEYSGLSGISEPAQAILLRRSRGTTIWTDAAATNNTSTRRLTLTGVTGSYEYSIGVNSGVNPLPVELVSFAAHRGTNAITLRWQTATELNSYAFEIEFREESASDWRVVASVPAAGMSSSPRSYEWTHTDAPVSAMQYRLHMVDRDGSSEYSAVLSVRAENLPLSLSFEVYPNPASGQATLTLNLTEAMDVSVRLTDILGRVRDVPVECQLDVGASAWPLDLSQHSPGLYMIEIRTHEGRYVRPLRITR
ncbi:MAG: LamG-like jellyroll fold domain-containing protein [Bacteroidota bacterium]